MNLNSKKSFISVIFATVVLVTFLVGMWIHLFYQARPIPLTILKDAYHLSPVAASPSPDAPPIKLLFGGDLMFDRNIRLKMAGNNPEWVLANLQPLFNQYTTVVANLEGPITNNTSRSVNTVPGSTANYIFTFDPQIALLLKMSNIRIVSIGNNHIGNFGQEGVSQTKHYLTEANVSFFGDTGFDEANSDRLLFMNFGSVRIAFVNYNQFVINGWEHALTDVQTAKAKADLVIVMPHWGIEYQPIANQVIQTQAHQLIEAGADLVVGSHPHVIQQSEEYQGKRIYYSLGNLVFDQYFSPETRKGLLVGVTILPNKTMQFQEYWVNLQLNGQTVRQ